MSENKLCQWCGCEVTGPHDEAGNHLDVYACKSALIKKVRILEKESENLEKACSAYIRKMQAFREFIR